MEAGVAAVVLAAAHAGAGLLRVLDGVPRSRWLSLAGGISVAYVFVHLLPELAEAQARLRESAAESLRLEQHAYLLALAGLALFYGVERATVQARTARPAEGRGDLVFWFSIASFAVYTALIGYALEDVADAGASTLALFAVAMGTHFLVNDYGLREHHERAYTRVGRWILAGAVLAGWLLSRAVVLPEAALVAVLAFVAGGVILNVLKEELPEGRRSRFSAFLVGAAAYAALLQMV